MVWLANIRKITEECLDFIEVHLRHCGVPLEIEQPYKATWFMGIWDHELHIRCGSINATEPRVSSIHTSINEAISEIFNNRHAMGLYIHFSRKTEETSVYSVELTVSLTRHARRKILYAYSVYELANGLGPKLYPAMLIDAMELEGMPWN